jgi:hypothetical protein
MTDPCPRIGASKLVTYGVLQPATGGSIFCGKNCAPMGSRFRFSSLHRFAVFPGLVALAPKSKLPPKLPFGPSNSRPR